MKPPPGCTLCLFVTGLPERPYENEWLRLLPAVVSAGVVQRLWLEFPSPFECIAPWNNDRIKRFVELAQSQFPAPPMFWCRRFTSFERWIVQPWRRGFDAYDPREWYAVYWHLSKMAGVFGASEVGIDAESYGDARPKIDLPNVNIDRLWRAIRGAKARARKTLVLPKLWARPGDGRVQNRILALAGDFRTSDSTRLMAKAPEWHSGDLRVWMSYISERLPFNVWTQINWAEICGKMSSTFKRRPQWVCVFSDVGGTTRLLEDLAEWRAG